MDARTAKTMRPEEFLHMQEGSAKRGNAYLRVIVRVTPVKNENSWLYRADEIDLENRPTRAIVSGLLSSARRAQSVTQAMSVVWSKVDDALDEEHDRLVKEG